MRSLIAAIAVLCSVVTAFAANPVGTYDVEGTSPGGQTYEGTVTVTKTGDTYKVVWEIGSSTYEGTAIGNKDFVAISYRSNGDMGLSLFGADGGNWSGVWTHQNGTTMGTEVWKRQ